MPLFKCDFGGGITCEVKISETFPEKGKTHIVEHQWSRHPNKNIVRPYVAWMNTVNQQMANQWGQRLMHCYQVGKNLWEFWLYVPGEKPKMVDKHYV